MFSGHMFAVSCPYDWQQEVVDSTDSTLLPFDVTNNMTPTTNGFGDTPMTVQNGTTVKITMPLNVPEFSLMATTIVVTDVTGPISITVDIKKRDETTVNYVVSEEVCNAFKKGKNILWDRPVLATGARIIFCQDYAGNDALL